MIPCHVGELLFNNVLCDLGATINLMPYFVFKRFGTEEIKPTMITFQLADRSIKYPRAVLEAVFVKVGKFIFPVDFIALDMEEYSNMPLVLGRPFSNTSRTIIDVHKGEIISRVRDKYVMFNINKTIKSPQVIKYIFSEIL